MPDIPPAEQRIERQQREPADQPASGQGRIAGMTPAEREQMRADTTLAFGSRSPEVLALDRTMRGLASTAAAPAGRADDLGSWVAPAAANGRPSPGPSRAARAGTRPASTVLVDLSRLDLLELPLPGGPALVPRVLPGGRDHWSHSAQGLAERCPAAWKHRYLDGVTDPPSLKMLAGSAFGAGLELFYSQALSTAEPADGVVLERAAASWDERINTVTAAEQAAATGRERMLDALAAHLTERDRPLIAAVGADLVAVERRFTLRLAGIDQAGQAAECAWTMTGYLDLELRDEIRDFKLAGRHPTGAAADASTQAGLYLLARSAEGDPAKRFIFDSTLRDWSPRSRTARFQDVITRRSPEQLCELQRRIARAAMTVTLADATGSWPLGPQGWWCSRNACSAWTTCPAGGAGAERPSLEQAAA